MLLSGAPPGHGRNHTGSRNVASPSENSVCSFWHYRSQDGRTSAASRLRIEELKDFWHVGLDAAPYTSTLSEDVLQKLNQRERDSLDIQYAALSVARSIERRHKDRVERERERQNQKTNNILRLSVMVKIRLLFDFELLLYSEIKDLKEHDANDVVHFIYSSEPFGTVLNYI